MSKLIKKFTQEAKIKGNSKLPRTGAFEVTIDGILVYSKFETGEFPGEKEIKGWF